MKKTMSLLLVLLLVTIALVTYIKGQVEDSQRLAEATIGQEVELVGLKKGQFAPNFTLQTLDGQTVSLEDYRGRKVMINFWATWCPPCKAEMPHMQNYYKKHAATDNVEILAVNLTYQDGSNKQIQQFVNGFDVQFPVLLAQSKDIAETYKILAIPTTFMIDSEGRVQHQITGPLDLEALQLYASKLK
ncbi:TlpA disulfide reductase family protein [Metasolibacillus fluoroglycofenilyticus]|uniref:TlpA disulfide reductase family protein n=1 Tax=Metasolibacillus fluoroglycofenilyticus TaxID=1239396 RepID=UPI000D3DAC40|nr:TlpA disulfide reductase family protein [Metasolibacillus fluoroglycofenilyticus]